MLEERKINIDLPYKYTQEIKLISDCKWKDFISRLRYFVDDIITKPEYELIYEEQTSVFLEEYIYKFNQNKKSKSKIFDLLIDIDDIISVFLTENMGINNFYLWDNLVKKLVSDLLNNNWDTSIYEKFLEKFKIFVYNVNLDKIPYINNDLEEITSNDKWKLIADLNNDWNIFFKFLYNHSEKLSSIYLKGSKVNWLLKEYQEYQDYKLDWTYDEVYLDWIKNEIFWLLDLLKRNKDKKIWEVFYDEKSDLWVGFEEVIADIYDFIISNPQLFNKTEKLRKLYDILYTISEWVYKYSLKDIFDKFDIEFSQKEIQLLKTEFFVLLEKIKSYMK